LTLPLDSQIHWHNNFWILFASLKSQTKKYCLLISQADKPNRLTTWTGFVARHSVPPAPRSVTACCPPKPCRIPCSLLRSRTRTAWPQSKARASVPPLLELPWPDNHRHHVYHTSPILTRSSLGSSWPWSRGTPHYKDLTLIAPLVFATPHIWLQYLVLWQPTS
jgi:hypothetical protein